MSETHNETLTAEDVRKMVDTIRPIIFDALVSITDTKIKEAAHNGAYSVIPSWGKAPDDMKKELIDYYKRYGYKIDRVLSIITISWRVEDNE